MTPEQVIDLLTAAAARDRRTIGKADVMAWHADIGDLGFDDAMEAIGVHFRESTDWLMPAHVRHLVKRIRDNRDDHVPGPGLSPEIPDADPDDIAGYLAAIREQRTRAADGRDVPALDAGQPAGDPWDTPAVRDIAARFKAEQDAARRRKAEQARADSDALRLYRNAIETLLNLSDHGAAALAAARDFLLGDEQAAQGFPLLAQTPGVMDEHKITIWAAEAARHLMEERCAPSAD